MDTGFHYDRTLSSGLNRHAISFQTSAVASTSEMMMMGDYYPMNSTATLGTRFSNCDIANSSSGFTQAGNPNSSGSVLADSIPGLKHDAGLAVEWSSEEQHKLDEGLSQFADEPSIMRYIKIAATLRDKTVRDVALRCRWMARKRRKQEGLNMGKKLKDKKDTLVESSTKPSISSVPTLNVAPFSFTMNNHVQIDSITFEALSGSIRNLLEQNNQVIGQISSNISSMKVSISSNFSKHLNIYNYIGVSFYRFALIYSTNNFLSEEKKKRKLQDNIDLFNHMKNNITTILNNMRYMPGPPFPVSLNEDLAHSILPTSSQTMMFEGSGGMYMKQEPGF